MGASLLPPPISRTPLSKWGHAFCGGDQLLVCAYHHRLHHRGAITLTGPAHQLTVTDSNGDVMTDRSLARPPTKPPPAAAPWHGSSGERAQWWWYDPYEPPPPAAN